MGENTVCEFEKGGYKLEVYVDDWAESPREWDNIGTMVCYHRNYVLGDEQAENLENYDSWNEWFEAEIVEYNGGWDNIVYLPLYLLDHSGITMNTYGFNDPWDSGQVGFIFATKDKFRKETMYSEEELFGQGKLAEGLLRQEVDIYDDYLRGNVYGFSIEKVKICECCGNAEYEYIDSCGGFYGDLEEAIEQMKEQAGEEFDFLFDTLIRKEL